MSKTIICPHCHKEIKNSLNRHNVRCKKYQTYKKEADKRDDEILTEEILQDLYVKKELSASMIAQNLGIRKISTVIKKLVEYGIHVRTPHEAHKTKSYIETTKKTCQEKYGADYHTCKDSTIRQKIFNSVTEKYGVEHLFQSEIIKEKIKKSIKNKYDVENISQLQSVKDKKEKSSYQRYGVSNPRKSPEVIQKILQTKHDKLYSYSPSSKKADKFFSELLEMYDNEHVYTNVKSKEFGIKVDDKYFYYDFVDTSTKRCIEYNGNYYHGNPKMYEDDFIIRNTSVKERHEFDRRKNASIKEKGYDILVIWESEEDDDHDGCIKKCYEFLIA